MFVVFILETKTQGTGMYCRYGNENSLITRPALAEPRRGLTQSMRPPVRVQCSEPRERLATRLTYIRLLP